jgi:hypothetical protein
MAKWHPHLQSDNQPWKRDLKTISALSSVILDKSVFKARPGVLLFYQIPYMMKLYDIDVFDQSRDLI